MDRTTNEIVSQLKSPWHITKTLTAAVSMELGYDPNARRRAHKMLDQDMIFAFLWTQASQVECSPVPGGDGAFSCEADYIALAFQTGSYCKCLSCRHHAPLAPPARPNDQGQPLDRTSR